VIGEMLLRHEELTAWINAAGGIGDAIRDSRVRSALRPTTASNGSSAEMVTVRTLRVRRMPRRRGIVRAGSATIRACDRFRSHRGCRGARASTHIFGIPADKLRDAKEHRDGGARAATSAISPAPDAEQDRVC
jgi:hypothetical protein